MWPNFAFFRARTGYSGDQETVRAGFSRESQGTAWEMVKFAGAAAAKIG
jgi:hypothetical protein